MKSMHDLKALRLIPPLIYGVDITTWFYLRELGQKQLLSLHTANGNLKDAHLDWHKVWHIFKD